MPGNPALSHKNTLKFRLWLFFTVVPAVFFSDFAAKLIVRRTMTPYGETIPIVDGFIKLRFIYNEGIAFGLNPGFLSKWVLMIVSLVVVALLIGYIFLSRYDDRQGVLGLTLITGGALGNLHDRIMFGRVVDFIECGFREYTWPVFNIADIAVTCGAILLGIRLILFSEKTHER